MDNMLKKSHLKLVKPQRAITPHTEEDPDHGLFEGGNMESFDFKEYIPGKVTSYNKRVSTGGLYDNMIRIYQPSSKEDAKSRVANDSADYISAISSGLLELEDSVLRMIGTSIHDIFNQTVFQTDSVEDLISQQFSAYMDYSKADLIATELGKLIRISIKTTGLTIEERATGRELGLRLARQLAKDYFGNPKDVNAFTESMKSYAQRDEMLDKGYYFWEGQPYESYKPIPLNILWKRREHGGPRPYSDDDVETFRAKEKKVTKAINKAIASVTDDMVLSELMTLESGNIAELYPARDYARS